MNPQQTEIYDSTGKLLRVYPKGARFLDISFLKPGLYIVRVIDKNSHSSVGKLIKK